MRPLLKSLGKDIEDAGPPSDIVSLMKQMILFHLRVFFSKAWSKFSGEKPLSEYTIFLSIMQCFKNISWWESTFKSNCLLNSEKKKLEVALYHNNFYIVKPLGNKPGKYKTSGLLISYYQILCMHIWRICHWFLTKTSNLCHTSGNFDTRNRDCSYTFFQLLFC